jgi:hypothetical protein
VAAGRRAVQTGSVNDHLGHLCLGLATPVVAITALPATAPARTPPWPSAGTRPSVAFSPATAGAASSRGGTDFGHAPAGWACGGEQRPAG